MTTHSTTQFGFSGSPPSSYRSDQPDVLATSFSFQGLHPPRAPDFGQQYQQNGYFGQAQTKQYYQDPQTTLQGQFPSDFEPQSRKRVRRDSPDMHLPGLSKTSSIRQEGREISPGSNYPDEERDGRGSSFLQPFGQCFSFCMPYSGYGTTSGESDDLVDPRIVADEMRKVYQTVPSTSVYEATASRAYSADLQSPSQPGLPQYCDVLSQRNEKTDFLLPDSANPRLEHWPPLQPASHPVQPPTIEEGMHYPPEHVRHGSSISEESPVYLKSERPDQQFQTSDFPTSPVFAHSVDDLYSHPSLANPAMNLYPQQAVERYAPPPQTIASHGYISSEAPLPEVFDYFPLVSHGGDLSVVMQNQKPPATKRGPFKDLKKREITAQVRKVGSCIRCRMQRIRVSRTAGHHVLNRPLTRPSANLTQSHRVTTTHHVRGARRY